MRGPGHTRLQPRLGVVARWGGGALPRRGLWQSASLDGWRRVRTPGSSLRACTSTVFAGDLDRAAAYVGPGVVISGPCVFKVGAGVLIARTSTSMSAACVMTSRAVIWISGAGVKTTPQVELMSRHRVLNVGAGVLTTRASKLCFPT